MFDAARPSASRVTGSSGDSTSRTCSRPQISPLRATLVHMHRGSLSAPARPRPRPGGHAVNAAATPAASVRPTATMAERDDVPRSVLEDDRVPEAFREQIQHLRDMRAVEQQLAELVADPGGTLLSLCCSLRIAVWTSLVTAANGTSGLRTATSSPSALGLSAISAGSSAEGSAELDDHPGRPGGASSRM